MLIGQDVPQALIPLEVRHGNDFEPYAERTHLGWVHTGPMTAIVQNQEALCNLIHATTKPQDE